VGKHKGAWAVHWWVPYEVDVSFTKPAEVKVTLK